MTSDILYEHTHRHAFGGGRTVLTDRVGLEVELFAFVKGGVVDEISRCRRQQVADVAAVVSWLEIIGEEEGWGAAQSRRDTPLFTLSNGGTITLEPGGQLEYSSRPYDDVVEALNDVDTLVALLESRADGAGIELRVKGYNNECYVDDIGLQLSAARYRAMDSYFASIGPFGKEMMRATAALQINLDFGTGGVAAERWRLANMIAPSMNALFANSQHMFRERRFRSFRSEIWRHVDPTRTGRLFDKPDLDPVADYLRFALDARVMLVADDNGDCVSPAFRSTFRDWLDGIAIDAIAIDGTPLESRLDAKQVTPARSYPTMADWELHLTTLFPDVRARGSMELRSIDALPGSDRRVAVALVTTLMYDDTARRAALQRLESRSRVRIATDHEHDGYWRSDLATGRELLSLALPHIDSRLRDACARYHTRTQSRC